MKETKRQLAFFAICVLLSEIIWAQLIIGILVWPIIIIWKTKLYLLAISVGFGLITGNILFNKYILNKFIG